ncbi:MAG: glycerol-3-phosphate 1-O-acyltransferase PlsB [Enterobacterales bacterium]|nr:glycerol-3-phosphate 1-O-acyltransferase PlsB [Enterobacterales bacterium]
MFLSRIYQKLVEIPLKLLVSSKLVPEDPIQDLAIDPNSPIYYILQRRSTSSFLILKEKAQRLNLPAPKLISVDDSKIEQGAVFFLQSKTILGLGGKPVKKYQKLFAKLIDTQKSDPKRKHQLIPLSIYWGRNPGKENSLLKLLFTDTESANPIRKFFLFIFQGRNTFVRIAKPVDLQKMVFSDTSEEMQVTKLTRTLRVHFHRLRQVAMGPLITNRGQVVTNIVVSDNVKAAIKKEASAKKIKPAKAKKLAEKYVKEIASAYSYKAVRFMESSLTHLWNRIYDGVLVNNAEMVRDIASTHEIVYVPCHRSHIDYLLLSYTLYHEGLVPPHIAAGINLNFWPAGPLLRRGGAFFLRRSFGGNKLYTSVFNEYIYQLMDRGIPLEFFLEGGRSRTGRLLPPKTGLLAMVVQSLLRGTRKPVAIIPVYIGYERMFEGKSYLNELRGADKKKESFGQLLGIRKTLKQNFGKVHLNFAKPIFLNQYLDKEQADWHDYKGQVGAKPSWLTPQVSSLSELIMQHINSAVTINAISLVALVLLSTERMAIGKKELETQLNLLLALLKSAPYSDNTQIPNENGMDLIKQAEALGVIFCVKNPMGDIVTTDEQTAILLTYYRNNILHVFIGYSLVASCFLNCKGVTKSALIKKCQAIFPLLKRELYIHWDDAELKINIQLAIEFFIDKELVSEKGDQLIRADEATEKFDQLMSVAQFVRPSLLRYGILLTLLSNQAGQGRCSRRDLERQSQQVAQRLAALYSLNAPESFDKNLFKTTISVLKDANLIQIAKDNSFDIDPKVALLNQRLLENVNQSSKHIMQKTANWARKHWEQN